MKAFSPRPLRFVLIVVALTLCAVLAWRLAGAPSRPLPEPQKTVSKTESHSPTVSPLARRRVPRSDTEAVPVAFADTDTPEARIITDRPRFVQKTSGAQRNAGKGDLELQKVSMSLRNYRTAFHENPVGTNAEITRKLLGKNSQGTRYLAADARVNDKGQLTDRWDRPVFFHQISRTTTELRSAGPDHVMWTGDDEVLR